MISLQLPTDTIDKFKDFILEYASFILPDRLPEVNIVPDAPRTVGEDGTVFYPTAGGEIIQLIIRPDRLPEVNIVPDAPRTVGEDGTVFYPTAGGEIIQLIIRPDRLPEVNIVPDAPRTVGEDGTVFYPIIDLVSDSLETEEASFVKLPFTQLNSTSADSTSLETSTTDEGTILLRPDAPRVAPATLPPGVFATPVDPVPASGDYQIDTLLSGTKWQDSTITYSFLTNGIGYYGNEIVSSVSASIKARTRFILENILEPYLNINFVEVSDSASSFGTLRYMLSDGPAYAYAYLPTEFSDLGGDVHLNPTYDYSGETNGFQNGPGTHGWMSLIHETLHALGIKHPGNYFNGGEPGPYLPEAEDNIGNTLMSYHFAGSSAATAMPNDIKALQYLYGAASYNANSTYYDFSTVYDFVGGAGQNGGASVRSKQTLMDTGGSDWIDLSALAPNALGYIADLSEGGLITETGVLNGSTYFHTSFGTGPYTTFTYGTRLAYGTVIENLIGSASNDDIRGNAANNVLRGRGGNDTLRGNEGNDRLDGDGGSDLLDGGLGNDTLVGGDSADTLLGGAGFDTLIGGSGNDVLDGGTNNDRLSGGDGDDLLNGGSGNDIIQGLVGNDILNGGDGDDLLGGNVGNDTLNGDRGNDTLNGIDGNDILNGGEGNDRLDGGGGNDVLNGGDGNDVLFGRAGFNLLDGGAGNDTLAGGNNADTLIGGVGADNLTGGGGNDRLDGGADNDRLNGGDGNDVLNGGDGDDIIQGLIGDDTLNGGDGDDLMGGNAGNDTLNGGNGNDTLNGIDGNDTLTGGAGNDRLDGGNGADVLIGGTLGSSGSVAQIDVLFGRAGRDVYVVQDMYEGFGNSDYALIRGFSTADDTIELGNGSHFLTATSGALPGGTGIYSNGDLLAIIEGFSPNSLNINASYFAYNYV